VPSMNWNPPRIRTRGTGWFFNVVKLAEPVLLAPVLLARIAAVCGFMVCFQLWNRWRHETLRQRASEFLAAPVRLARPYLVRKSRRRISKDIRPAGQGQTTPLGRARGELTVAFGDPASFAGGWGLASRHVEVRACVGDEERGWVDYGYLTWRSLGNV
jgi:hypothetical protein